MRERIPLNEFPPDLPSFSFTQAEREERLKKGMSEDEINAEEDIVRQRILRNHLDKESGQSKAA